MQATSLLEIGAARFSLHFQGFHQPLHVWLRGGQHVSLRPWTCGEHLAALGRHLRPGAAGVTLDTEALCGEVLAREGLEGALAEELAPLALWWAAGGGEPSPWPGAEGWLELGRCRARLRPWTAGERLKALSRCLRGEGAGRHLEVGRYLTAMVSASVRAVEPAGTELWGLDAASTAALLDAVVALNVAGEEEALSGSPLMAAATLRLCKELGWTPSQVWASPAPEVDRLLRLLEITQAVAEPPPAQEPRAGAHIADHPDAIVIEIEERPA